MKHNKIFKIFISSLAIMACGLAIGVSFKNGNNPEKTEAYYSPSKTYTNGDADTYYSSISDTAEGDTLLSALRSLNLSKRQSTVGYGSMGTSATSSAYIYTDYDPDYTQTDSNGQTYGTRVLSFYSGTSTTSWNREHVWPNSRGGGSGGKAGSPYPDADIFMPRPTITTENSDRGNSVYYEGMATSQSGWDPVTAFGEDGCYQGKNIRGECARIIFYCMTVNSNLTLNDSTSNDGTNMGKISDLIKWNLEYPVNEREKNRNEGGEYLQGNRNAFVDHPEYACKIWGNYNETTKALCAASTSAPTTLTMSPTSASIAVGGTTTLSVTADTGSSSVTWSTSNSSVATVSSGVVKGVGAGTCTITATSTVDTSVKCTATITVKAISSISISGTPNKTSYYSGDSFAPAGLTVTGHFSDGTTTTIDVSDCTWTPNPLTEGITSVTCTYSGKTATYTGITVSKATGYTLVTDASSLAAGDKILIGYKSSGVVAGTLSDEYLSSVSATYNDTTIESKPDSAVEFTLGGSSGAWTLANSSGQLLGATKVKNLAWDSGTTTWTISIATSGTATITNGTSSYGILEYNTNSPRFNTYSSGQKNPEIYRKSTDDADPVSVTGVSLDQTSLSIVEGKTSTLTATITPSDATNKNVTWSSSNENIATVSNGVVTAVKEGNTTITVTTADGSYTATCAVTVKAAPTLSSISISGTASKTSYFDGDTFDASGLTVTATYSDGSTSDVTSSVTWTPSPLTSGTTSVTATYNGKTATYTGITVSSVTAVSISLSGYTTKYNLNGAFSFDGTCTVTYNNGETATVTPTSVSSPDMSSAGNKVVTVTYGSLSATYTITVTETTIDNTIKKLYDYTSATNLSGNTFYGTFMGYTTRTSSSTTYYDIYLANGEYGIIVYGLSSSLATTIQGYTAGETCLSVTGGYLNIYKNLYEVCCYYNKNSYSITLTELTTTEAQNNIEHVVSYTITGDEDASTATTQKTASRPAIVAGTVASVSGTISSSNDTTVTITTASNKTVTVFIKYGSDLDYDTLASKLVVGNEVSLKGFSSIYSTTYQLVLPTVIEQSESYTAESFASDLLSLTTDICASSTSKASDLSKVWLTLEQEKYTQLLVAQRTILGNATANESGSTIEQAMARYDYIVAKYNLNDFIGRNISSSSNNIINLNNSTTTIVVPSIMIISLTGLVALGFYLFRKKKNN